eukprot:Seg5972.1 transcript_id=Seg5972.1/GoldUCD/mRNA.D3Y31 product="hypothetical protein" protein_id=Seg5972.1/GoldUCD/D3Y31
MKKKFICIVDNGPAEQPSSPLVQMSLIRILKYLNLSSICQVSFAEYNSKRNFVERVHATENTMLSRHGPFSSTKVHAKNDTDEKHRANIEAMSSDVIQCLAHCKFGKRNVLSEQGDKDMDYVFSDEIDTKHFLKLTEAKKEDCTKEYAANEHSKIHKDLVAIYNIGNRFKSSYARDYSVISERDYCWRHKYTFHCIQPRGVSSVNDFMFQPIPDYVRWQLTGELHYMPFENRKQLPAGIWNEEEELFLPSNILHMVYAMFADVPEHVMDGVCFLCWCPRKEVKVALTQQHEKFSEEIAKDNLREKLLKTDLYKNSKAQLVQLCQQERVLPNGTKLELAARLATKRQIKLDDNAIPLYAGDLENIPNTVMEIRKFTVAKMRAILNFHNISTTGSQDQLALKVSLLGAGRKHLIHSNEIRRLLDIIRIAKDII